MGRRKKFEIKGVDNPTVEMDPEGGRQIMDDLPYQMEWEENPRFKINRSAYTLKTFQQQFDMVHQDKPGMREKCFKTIKKAVSCSPINFVKTKFPITDWLLNYNCKEYLLADIIVGITLAVFIAPQCMGYSLIAHVPPIHGLYSGFFPTIVYAFMGTSRHSSVGGEIMLSGVMTGNIILKIMEENGQSLHEIEAQISEPDDDSKMSTILPHNFGTETYTLEPSSGSSSQINHLHSYEIACAVSFILAIIFPIASFLRMGFISIYLSEQFLSGCITAASLFAFVSQLRYVFGVHYPYRSGFFSIFISIADVFIQYKETNLACVVISVCAIIILLIFKIYINPWILKFRYGINFPIELVVVVIGTLLSNLLSFNEVYNVPIVGPLPAGIPTPKIPRWSIIQAVGLRTVPGMLYSFTITLSIGKMYGAKHGYKVDANQELLALGASNMLGSVFSSIPSCASLPRSATQEAAGGKTQLVSVISSILMLLIILFLSPLLKDLPTCILGSIIVVSLRNLLGKVRQFHMYWKVSKIDGAVWLFTFCAILALDMDMGLYLSLAFSLLTLILKSSRPKTYLLGSVDKSDLYVPINKYMDAKEIPGVKIYQFCGPLHFASFEYFKKDLLKKINLDLNHLTSLKEDEIQKYLRARRETRFSIDIRMDIDLSSVRQWATQIANCRIIIIDCSMLSYIDTSGVAGLKNLASDFQTVGIKFFLASCAAHVTTMLSKDHYFSEIGQNSVFLSVHDAALVAIKCLDSGTERYGISRQGYNSNHRNADFDSYREIND